MELDGRLVVVSGASRGIGAATAKALARHGAVPLLLARTEAKLHEVQRAIEAEGGEAASYAVDLGRSEAVAGVADVIREVHGVPDVIVNNAGAGRWLAVEETPPDEAVDMMAAPYFAAFFLTRAFLPAMIERGVGHVVNVNSPAGLVPIPGAAGYSASRAALRSFDGALGEELRGTGVGVTHLVAGKVSSTYFEANPGSEERVPSITRLIPTLTPEQVADRLVEAVRRGQREVVIPFTLRSFWWLHQVAPWLVRRLVWATAWSRG